MSWYLTIRSDARYSEFAETIPLVAFLAEMPEVHQVGPVEFRSAYGQPQVTIVMALCCQDGNYSSNEKFIPRINVVELVCSYDGNPEWYAALACRIAIFLGWSAFEDHEERQVWPLPVA